MVVKDSFKKTNAAHSKSEPRSQANIIVQKSMLGGVETHVTTSTCENPIAEVHFLKGFKSDPQYYKRLIRKLHDNNINVVMITLPDPAEDINYLDDYEKITKAVFVDGALDKSGFPPTPKFALSHSTGGYLLTKLLTDQDNAQAISKRYQSGIFAAPYYGSKWHRMQYFGRFGRAYSNYHADKPVGMTWLERKGSSLMERFFNKASGYNDGIEKDDVIEQSEDMKAWANHRQGIYMDGPTAELIHQIRQNGFPEAARKFPTIFLTATQDKVCHNPSIIEVASYLDAHHISVRGGHSLLRKTQEGPSLLLDTIKVRLHDMKIEEIGRQAAAARKLLPLYPSVTPAHKITPFTPKITFVPKDTSGSAAEPDLMPA